MLIGKTFGYWTIIAHAPDRASIQYQLCRCKCGTIKEVRRSGLENGQSRSCGCFNREASSSRFTTHGGSSSGTYWSWNAMLHRCINKEDKAYDRYGGAGITVDPRWQDFETFRADMGERPENTQLDRIDNKGHYNKANCRWSTRSENLLNRADSLTFRGQKMSRENIAKSMGITRGTLARRMKEYPSLTLEEMYYL